jgi:hypothetical protein
METRLHVATAYDAIVSYLVGKDIRIPESLAKEKGINPGSHEISVSWETSQAIKIHYKSKDLWLPKDAVKIVTVNEKKLFDF